jgi:hypothetical protein
MAWQNFKVDLKGLGLDADQRDEVADLVIERIVNRSDQGMGLNADGTRLKKFPGYSESYKKSLDFAIAGKQGKPVNLQLSGDMLAAIKVLKSTNQGVWIGFDDESENAKAEGNILGTYGSDNPKPGKARNFLGITNQELMKIVDFVKGE